MDILIPVYPNSDICPIYPVAPGEKIKVTFDFTAVMASDDVISIGTVASYSDQILIQPPSIISKFTLSESLVNNYPIGGKAKIAGKVTTQKGSEYTSSFWTLSESL